MRKGRGGERKDRAPDLPLQDPCDREAGAGEAVKDAEEGGSQHSLNWVGSLMPEPAEVSKTDSQWRLSVRVSQMGSTDGVPSALGSDLTSAQLLTPDLRALLKHLEAGQGPL